MSDIIDATAMPTTQLEQAAAVEIPPVIELRVPARDYVRMAQGFYFIFWGLLLTVLTGAQLLMLIDMPPFAESLLGVGVLATAIGSWRLYQVRSLGDLWHRRIRQTFVLAMLMAYFCLFFYLWRRVQDSTFLLGNVLAFATVGIVYVIAFNRVVGVLAGALGRKDMVFESRMFGTGNIGLLLLPFGCIIAYIIGMAVLQRTNPIAELQYLLGRANLLIIIVLLLPFSLTLSLAWSCKDAVLRQLYRLGHPPDSSADLS
jgi:hypothetical protein